MASLLDTRGIAKPPVHDGKDETWGDFAFRFESYVALLGWSYALESAEDSDQPIAMDQLAEDPKNIALNLYALLASVTSGRSLSILKLVGQRNGLEAWRLLKKEYEPKSGNRVAGLLRAVLNPKWWDKELSSGKDFCDILNKWEIKISEYTQASGDTLSEAVKVATVLEHAPSPYKDLLRAAHESTRKTYPDLKSYIREYQNSGRQYDNDDVVPMQVDGATLGKSKGETRNIYRSGKGKSKDDPLKGKVKGKHKDKGKGYGSQKSGSSTYFEGECRYCGKWGHRKADCRKRIADQGGKPKAGAAAASTAGPPTSTASGATLEMDEGGASSSAGGLWCTAAVRPDHSLACGALVLLDSGSDEHICGRDFGSQYGYSTRRTEEIRDIQGKNLETFGRREVQLKLGREEREDCQVDFLVGSVHAPVMSVGKLVRKGFRVNFELGNCFLEKGNRRVAVQMTNNTFRIPAEVAWSAADGGEKRLAAGADRVAVPPGLDDEPLPPGGAALHAPPPGGEAPAVDGDSPGGEGVREPAAGGPALSMKSTVKQMRARLMELGRPAYGSKCILWARLVEAEREAQRLARHEEFVQERSQAQARGDVPVAAHPVPGPGGPSAVEREQHELTHCPYASWCEVCVQSKGREGPHSRTPADLRDGQLPVVQADFCTLRSGSVECAGVESTVVLILSCMSTGMVKAVPAVSKETTPFMVTAAVAFIRAVHHNSRVVLRTDNEPSIESLAKAVAREAEGRIDLQTTPRYSPQSLGSAEKAVDLVCGQFRATRTSVERAYRATLTPTHNVWPWLVRHASWTLCRFAVKGNGLTAYRNAYGVDYRGEIVPVLETVMFKRPVPQTRYRWGKTHHKADLQWEVGIWAGRREENDEHIILTSAGVQFARTIRRFEPSRRHQLSVLDSVKGVPWDDMRDRRPGRPRLIPQMPAPDDLGRGGPSSSSGGAGVIPSGRDASTFSPVPEQPSADGGGSKTPPPPSSVPGASTDPHFAAPSLDPVQPHFAAPATDLDVGMSVAPPSPAGSGGGESPAKKARVVAGVLAETEDEEVDLEWLEWDEDPSQLDPSLVQSVDQAKAIEMKKFQEFDAYEVVSASEVPPGTKHITTAWVIDYKEDRGWKARFVAREFKKQEWWLNDLFAASSHPMLHRVIDHLSLKLGQHTFGCDATNAFLHVPETEDVVVVPPSEWMKDHSAAGGSPDVMWKLKKQIYGRRRAGQAWVNHFAAILESLGLRRCAIAPQFFSDSSRGIYVEVHMDDLHGTAPEGVAQELLKAIGEQVAVKTYGPTRPGDKYVHLKRRREVCHGGVLIGADDKHIARVAVALGLERCNPVGMPSTVELNMQPGEDDRPLSDEDTKLYRSCVGTMMYWALDREDVQLETSVLARHLKSPTEHYMKLVKRLVRYAKGATGFKAWMPAPVGDRDQVRIEVFSDSDWAGEQQGRRSRSSCHIDVDGCPMAGWSNRQSIVAQSSAEAEFYSATSAVSGALMFRAVYEEFGFRVILRLRSDASAAIGMMRREGAGRIRHISVRCLWLQQLVKEKKVEVVKIHTSQNKADLGTKPMGKARFEELRAMVGLVQSPPVSREREDHRFASAAQSLTGGLSAEALLRGLIAAGLVHQGVATSELCIAGSVQPHELKSDPTVVYYMLVALLVAVVLAFISGMLCHHVIGSRFHVTEVKVSHQNAVPPSVIVHGRTVSVQSPVTYLWHRNQPRFQPLGERNHGVWVESGVVKVKAWAEVTDEAHT